MNIMRRACLRQPPLPPLQRVVARACIARTFPSSTKFRALCDDAASKAAKQAIANMERMKGEIAAAQAVADDAVNPSAAMAAPEPTAPNAPATSPPQRGCSSGVTVVPPNDELTSLIDLHGNHLRKVLRFPIGAQVECRLGEDKWLPGKVIGHLYRQKEWPEKRRAPYQVQIDGDGPEQPGPKIFVPQDSDDCVRTALRFPQGSVIECNLGEEQGWALGVVMQHYYMDPSWEPGRWVPYQIKLADETLTEGDRLVWAPVDESDCVRAPLFAPSFLSGGGKK